MTSIAPLVARLQDALAALGDRDEELRARLLARLSVELTYDPDESLRESMSLQAVESARRSGAPAALAAALSARHVALSHPEHTTARLQTATEMLEVARRAGDRELALQARNWRVADLFELGDGARVQAELDAYAALAADVRLSSYSWYVPLWRATLAALAGRLDEGRELAERARDLGRRAGDANADVFFQTHRYMSWLADERYEEWVGEALAFTEEKIQRSPAGLAYLAGIATVFAATGRADDARRAIEIVAADDFATVPRDMNWLSTIASAAEVCATLGDTQRARTVQSLLEPYADRMVISARAAHHQGSVAYFLARLAAAVGDHRAADELYGDAAQRDERAGAAIWVVRDQSAPRRAPTRSTRRQRPGAAAARTRPRRSEGLRPRTNTRADRRTATPCQRIKQASDQRQLSRDRNPPQGPLLSPCDVHPAIRAPGPATRGKRARSPAGIGRISASGRPFSAALAELAVPASERVMGLAARGRSIALPATSTALPLSGGIGPLWPSPPPPACSTREVLRPTGASAGGFLWCWPRNLMSIREGSQTVQTKSPARSRFVVSVQSPGPQAARAGNGSPRLWAVSSSLR